MKNVLLLCAATMLLAACAAQDPSPQARAGWEEPQYRTGSHLPARRPAMDDGVTSVSREDLDRMRESSQNPVNRLPPPRPGSN